MGDSDTKLVSFSGNLKSALFQKSEKSAKKK